MTEAERCRPGLFLFPEAGVDVLSWGILFPAETEKPDIGNSMSGFEGAYSAG